MPIVIITQEYTPAQMLYGLDLNAKVVQHTHCLNTAVGKVPLRSRCAA